MKCEDCKFGKCNRYLSERQEIEYALSKCLVESDKSSRDEKYRILEGIAKSFCKLLLINSGHCDKWERKWWKFWVNGG